jgi:hypothetical protein
MAGNLVKASEFEGLSAYERSFHGVVGLNQCWYG